MTLEAATATQGHRYRVRAGVFKGSEVLCLAGGDLARVALIDEAKPWPLGSAFLISAQQLEPLAMRYFGGEVPR